MRIVRALPVVCLIACTEVPGTPEVENVARRCEQAICGNSPHLGARAFWELDEEMTQFSPEGGFRITGITSMGGVELVPVVIGEHFHGRADDGTPYSVVGGTMHVEGSDGSHYDMHIASGNDNPGGLYYYEDGHEDEPEIPTFELTYAEVDAVGNLGPWNDVCPDDTGEPNPRDAIIFGGDRYDVIGGSVSAIGQAARPWFNIACNDDSIWKLFLMRHTSASSGVGFTTTKAQRTAALRSIRADYCGNGHPYTKLGTDVDWLNLGGWLTHDAVAYPEVEAVWGENGALCLSNTRLEKTVVGCRIPTCTNTLTWLAGSSMRTFLP